MQAANRGKLFDSPRPISLLAVTDDPLAQDSRPSHSRRTDNKCLLPDIQGNPVHVRLEARWRWFPDPANGSSGGLQQANHDKIADGMVEALVRDLSYDCIAFDAANGRPSRHSGRTRSTPRRNNQRNISAISTVDRDPMSSKC